MIIFILVSKNGGGGDNWGVSERVWGLDLEVVYRIFYIVFKEVGKYSLKFGFRRKRK